MADDITQLGESIVRTIGESKASDTLIDAVEKGIDAFLDDSVVRDVPILGTLVGVWKTGGRIRDFLFLRKLQRFMFSLREVAAEQRRAFTAKLDKDPKQRQRVGQKLLLLLERFDDEQKADLLARAFGAYILEEVSYDDFQRLSYAIDRCLIPDLAVMHSRQEPKQYDPAVAQGLSLAGLLEIAMVPGIRTPQVHNQYQPTELGKLFRCIVLRVTN